MKLTLLVRWHNIFDSKVEGEINCKINLLVNIIIMLWNKIMAFEPASAWMLCIMAIMVHQLLINYF